MKKKLLVITRDQKEFKQLIETYNFDDLDIYIPEDEAGILEHIEDAEIIFWNPLITRNYINRAKKLKWMQSTFAWIDAMNKDDLKKDYILTNMRNIYGEIMSEYVLGYILMLEKDILWNRENQKKKVWWQKANPSIVGKNIGIMWIGSIGWVLAKYAKNFWMNVYWYATEERQQEYVDMVYTEKNIRDFLTKLDYLVSVLPNTEKTQWIINMELLSQLPKSATFINVGRWANVNENDLIEALRSKTISSAVLDVFQAEPLPDDSQFWDLDNVYVTPHVSWYVEDNSKIVKIFAENYSRYKEGKDLLHTIDFTKGY